MTNIENAIPGYMSAEMPAPNEFAETEGWTREQWQSEFDSTWQKIVDFIAARDPYVVLARTAARFLMEGTKKNPAENRIEQPEVEVAQAIILMHAQPLRQVPASPGNFMRYWPMMSRHLHSFIRKQNLGSGLSKIEDIVAERARLQTLYYRNLFTRDDCIRTMRQILKPIGKKAESELGYNLEHLFDAMVRMSDIVSEQINVFSRHTALLMTTPSRDVIDGCVSFFCDAYPLAKLAWRDSSCRFQDIEDYRLAAFQMSELAYPSVFTIKRDTLSKEFDSSIIAALYELSMKRGDLSDLKREYIYLDNPVWRRPYIHLDNGDLFSAVPSAIFSFPFLIFERIIQGRKSIEGIYEKSKSETLEASIFDVVKTSLPSAKVYKGVVWNDPETQQIWENDVVAVLGNFIFIFEAKSGRIKDAARRGGIASLYKNFKELFVEPAQQSWRLQNYINTQKQNASFRLKHDGSEISINLDRPKVIFNFSICYEHFASLTSANYYLKELGLISRGTPWSPVLSLGEMFMLSLHLDTEISFQHYLTRRYTIESLIDFEGDEQDLLSVYLTNGMHFDSAELKGVKIIFQFADSPSREAKTARMNRREVELIGAPMPPLWRSIVKELYLDEQKPNRFDIINIILNQHPGILLDYEQRIRRFRSGVPLKKGQDIYISRLEIGSGKFVLAVHLAKMPYESAEWHASGRGIVSMFAEDKGAVDCAFFLFARKPKQITYHAVSFYRYGFIVKEDKFDDDI